jgi:hypothetical protein
MILGGVDIYIRYGHGVNPYFHLPTSRSRDGWQKVLFFLRNNADTLLHVFTGSRLIPVIPRSEKEGMKPPYVCPGCSNHTYGQQYGEQIQYLVKLQTRIFTK